MLRAVEGSADRISEYTATKNTEHDEICYRSAKGGESNILNVRRVKRFLNLISETICLSPCDTKLIIVELKLFFEAINQ